MASKTVLPQEIEVWYILPAIRKALAEEMGKLGLSNKQIAEKLNVTEAAVSQYFSKKRGADVKFSAGVHSAIKASAKELVAGQSMLSEMNKITNTIWKTEDICQIHRQFDKTLPKECEVCFA